MRLENWFTMTPSSPPTQMSVTEAFRAVAHAQMHPLGLNDVGIGVSKIPGGWSLDLYSGEPYAMTESDFLRVGQSLAGKERQLWASFMLAAADYIDLPETDSCLEQLSDWAFGA